MPDAHALQCVGIVWKAGYHARMNDPRAKQAMFLAKKSQKSSMGPGSGRAIMWIVLAALAAGGAIWAFFSMA